MTAIIKALLEGAAKVSTDHQLMAFAIVAVLIIAWLITKRVTQRRGTQSTLPLLVLGALILVAVLVATLGPTYLDHFSSTITIRVSATGPDGGSVSTADVSSNAGGEVKTVNGGWEIDVPTDKVQADGLVDVTVRLPSAFAEGHQTVDTRGRHRSVSVNVTLVRDTSARIRGTVLDSRGNAVVGARVQVSGWASEGVVTGVGGGFDLAAHAAPGQQVSLHAEKAGYRPANQFCPAGSTPAELRLLK